LLDSGRHSLDHLVLVGGICKTRLLLPVNDDPALEKNCGHGGRFEHNEIIEDIDTPLAIY